jgi:hypothetical protein
MNLHAKNAATPCRVWLAAVPDSLRSPEAYLFGPLHGLHAGALGLSTHTLTRGADRGGGFRRRHATFFAVANNDR